MDWINLVINGTTLVLMIMAKLENMRMRKQYEELYASLKVETAKTMDT